jgi:MraZ protein
VTAHTERCLLLYPLSTWTGIENKLRELSDFGTTGRFRRHLVGHATEVEMDKQGRLLLPPVLREYARLGREVMLVGKINGFEVWDGAAWAMQRDDFLATASDAEGLPDSIRSLTL